MRRVFSSLRILPVASIGRFYGGDDGKGGAGDGGNGSGNPSGGEQPAGLTEDKVNELINKALGPRFRAFEEKQAKATADAHTKLLETLGSTLDEKLSALKPTEDGDKGKGGKPPATDIKLDPEFRAMQKQLKEQAALLEKAQQDKAAETARARDEALNRKVEAELTSYGVSDPESARILLQGKKLVGYEDDDGESVVFRDEEGGALPLKKGLESWVKSAVGKRFLPPSGANGSGDRPNGKKPASSNGTSTKVTDQELGEALARELGLPLS